MAGVDVQKLKPVFLSLAAQRSRSGELPNTPRASLASSAHLPVHACGDAFSFSVYPFQLPGFPSAAGGASAAGPLHSACGQLIQVAGSAPGCSELRAARSAKGRADLVVTAHFPGSLMASLIDPRPRHCIGLRTQALGETKVSPTLPTCKCDVHMRSYLADRQNSTNENIQKQLFSEKDYP